MRLPADPPPSLPEHLHTPLAGALPGVRFDRVHWIGQGWGAMAFLVPASDGDRVLRVPREGVSWAVDDLEREARMLPALAKRPFTVAVPRDPRLLVDEAGRTAGVLHRFVPGTPLQEVTAPRGAARHDLLAGIGRFLSVLHGTDLDLARRYGVEERELWSDVYLPRIEETLPLLGNGTRLWFQEKVERFLARGGESVPRPVLIHGDISGDHLLVDAKGRLTGVIDFAEARISDPALDFAGILNRLSWSDLEKVLETYTCAQDGGLRLRVQFYIEISPVFSVTDGFIALGEAERRRGLRRLTARAAAQGRNRHD